MVEQAERSSGKSLGYLGSSVLLFPLTVLTSTVYPASDLLASLRAIISAII